MSANNNTTNARNLIYLAFTALLVGAGTATALPLPIHQDIGLGTPAGNVSASASESGAKACLDTQVPQLPSLPAVPSLPVPVAVPVAVPSVPAIQGSANSCVAAGLDGASIDAGADAMGLKADAKQDVDTSEQHETVKQASGGLKGFLTGITDRITSLF